VESNGSGDKKGVCARDLALHSVLSEAQVPSVDTYAAESFAQVPPREASATSEGGASGNKKGFFASGNKKGFFASGNKKGFFALVDL